MAQDCTGIQDIEDTSKMVEDTSRKVRKCQRMPRMHNSSIEFETELAKHCRSIIKYIEEPARLRNFADTLYTSTHIGRG